MPYSDKRKQVANHRNLRKWSFFRLHLAYSTSNPTLEQKHSSCWESLTSRHNDIALMSMYMTDTFWSFTRNVIFKSCFLFSEYGSIEQCKTSAIGDKPPFHRTETLERPLKDRKLARSFSSKISKNCCLCGMAPKTPERPLKDQKQLFQQDPRRILKTAESLLRDQ